MITFTPAGAAPAEALDAPIPTPEDESSHLVGLSADPVVSLRHVWRSWGRGKKRWTVLEDVTLDVNPGVAISISGSNGAGKTTLLRIATGILAPDEDRCRSTASPRAITGASITGGSVLSRPATADCTRA